ncbi:MAG: hypothetical protein BWY74_00665 [Firmicutes bacterium ADurb.Bin419]|nr:MAG: hypothetical protein BWY74_00665 [Firmicutes bacterium ADurb.Bin419]
MINDINEITMSEYTVLRTTNNRKIVLPQDITVNTINNILTRNIRYRKQGFNISFDMSKLDQAGINILHAIGFTRYCQTDSNTLYSNKIIEVLPITEITSNQQAAIAIANIYESINNSVSYSSAKSEYVSDIAVTLGEIIQNIPIHSEGDGIIYIYATEENKLLYLNCGVADDGIGISNSLREYQPEYRHFWNDSFAITLALQKGVSRFRKIDNGRGKGLSGLYERVQKWGGILHIRSGRGVFIYQNQDYNVLELEKSFSGVQIYLRVPVNNVQ